MLKPICVTCQRFYRMVKSGYAFIEGMPRDNAKPGTSEPEKWQPYKLWMGDLWECRGCGNQIIHGSGLHPIAEHYQPDFQADVLRHNATFQVNDC